MKKISTTVFYLFIIATCNISCGQTPLSEKYLKEAEQQIKEKKYVSSIRSFVNEKEEVNKMLGKELEKALPAKMDDWEMKYSEDDEVNLKHTMKPDPYLFLMVRVYYKGGKSAKKDSVKVQIPPANETKDANKPPVYIYQPKPAENPTMTISISNNSEYIELVEQKYNGADNNNMVPKGVEAEKFTVKENRAFIHFIKEYKIADMYVSLGKSVIRISGKNVTSPDALKALAEKIDLEILKSNLQ